MMDCLPRWAAASALLLGLSGCAALAPAQLPQADHTVVAEKTCSPLRPNLDQSWRDRDGHIRWPKEDGFATTPVPVVLLPGMLIDRFGCDTGHFFSPKGASFSARALPYACKEMIYTVFRISQPLLAWTGKAAGWFDEPGGATQFWTDAPVSSLVVDHVIKVVPDPAGAPCGPGG